MDKSEQMMLDLFRKWPGLSGDAKLFALLAIAQQIEAEGKPAEETPPALSVNVSENVNAEDVFGGR